MEFDYTSTTNQTHQHSSAPLSIKEISDKATHFDYNPLIPLRYWLRTADNLFKESQIYLDEGDEQQAYLLLLRWVELVLQYLSSHPERFQPENAINLTRAHHRAPDALRTLERLKPRLDARYQSYVASRRAQNDTTPQLASASSSSSSSSVRRKNAPTPLDLSMQRRMSATSLTGPFSPPLLRSPPPGKSDIDSRTLALEIARQEFEKRERAKWERRRLAALESGREAVLDSNGNEIRRIATPVIPPFPHKHIYSSPPTPRRETEEERREREAREDEEDIIESVKALSMGIDPSKLPTRGNRQSLHLPPVSRDSISAYNFDGFPEFRQEEVRAEPSVGRWTGSYPTVPKRTHSPSRFVSPPLSTISTPPLPPKVPQVPALPPKIPALPPSPKPEEQQQKLFSTPATLENGTPLRTMFLPSSLRNTFLAIAEPNTSANLETCGVLCGTLIQNALFISRLVIPEQEATSDTCATKDEEALFEYCNAEDLMVLGWIHTHPTQTCFMSSVDLHTHAGYQLMMKESIAIVCAPSKSPSWGVFRLTDPPGVQTIVNCRQHGLFHPHGEASVYTDAMRPGHVCVVKDMGFDVVDLRK